MDSNIFQPPITTTLNKRREMSLNVRKMWASAAHDMNMRTPQCMRHGQLVRVIKPVWGRATRARNIDCVPGSKIDATGAGCGWRVALGHGVLGAWCT